MRKVFFVFLLLCAQLFGAYEAQLLNFDKNFARSSNKQDFHHQLKNLYIQSIINEDEKSKIEILKRLVISSNALNLDDKGYVKELVESGIKADEIKALQAQNKQTPAKTNTQNTKATQEKNSSDIKQSPKTQNEAEKKRFVLQAKQEQNNIILSLNEELKQQELRISELKEKQNYRYIIDFKAALDTGRKEFKIAQARILLAQFDPQTTRLVIYADQKPDFDLKLDKNSLELEFKDEQNKPKKTEQVDKKTSTTNSAQIKTQTPQKTSQTKENKAKEKLFVLGSTKETNGIMLRLSDELDEDELQIFQMKDKDAYRIVINFEGVLEGKRKNFDFKNADISLTQYTPKIVRVVLSSKQELKLFKELDKKSLFLGFNSSQTNAKTQISKTNSNKINSNTKTTQNKQNQGTQTSPKNTSSRVSAKNKVIVIDAGHGGKDGGAVGGGGKLLEKNIVLSVALKLGEELKSKGYKVFYTRTSDKFINLRDRTKIANDKKANLFISIHANAAPNANKAKTMQGLETFFLSPARSERSKEVAAAENKSDLEEANFFSRQNFLHSLSREKIIASNRLAIDIQKNLLSKIRSKYKVVDGAVREAPFWVLVGAQDMPAVLIEIGYITHPEEGKRLASKSYQELLAQGIAAGVDNYFANNP
ncbi:N-acetylmuramoyl-L-alanine amidase [Campylobacter sp. MIT 12-8780]|uniref:N-acetylmuramoyl-L-alanine amidase n=1 Tax=unclassified Campylobacter TaxID=2593542 RepID=UPI00115E6C38|nr:MULTISPECIES: N-acetylmuramoyl-L-alanine amidase [unclassified Campylobacter]NDJ27774.1 N-acetylmuramoyl-L-alanine amidase [Campylobacter sp. MIT 19-121]TQR41090.1 N-acetylmuramoyl-L-alanine amidase [Campylobacter sp. MIT 12-8780]